MDSFIPLIQAARTTIGTMDFVAPSGFGQPKGAIFVVGFGTALGTVVNHSVFGFGMTDGVRNVCACGSEEDNLDVSNSQNKKNTTDCLMVIAQNQGGGAPLVRAQFDSWLTGGVDGVRINVSVTNGVAYQIGCILLGRPGVANFYCSTFITPATVDTGVDVTAPNFPPTIVLPFTMSLGEVFNDAVGDHFVPQIGFCVNDGANPHPQSCLGAYYPHGQGTTFVNTRMETNRTWLILDTPSGVEVEIQDFDSVGFSAFSRNVGGSPTLGYGAIELSGIGAAVTIANSPIVGGSHSLAGLPWKPQFALALLSALQTTDSQIQSGDSEVFGLSAIGKDVQFCVAVAGDHGVGTSNTESITDNKAINLRKDGAAFQTETFTSFDASGATFNASLANGTVRKRAILWVQESQLDVDELMGQMVSV